MDFENALVYRRVFNADEGYIVVEEKWDLAHPECPFIQSHFHAQNHFQSLSIRQKRMTAKEFWQSHIPLKSPSGIG